MLSPEDDEPGEVAGDLTPGAPAVPTRSYLVCCTPRSGSWLLAETLRRSGVAGRPREYFRPDYRAAYLARWGIGGHASAERFLRVVLAAGTTPNGVFGAKVHWRQLAEVGRLVARDRRTATPDRGRLAALLPGLRFVWLRRTDKERQAISYYRALQTDVWWASRRANRPRARSGGLTFEARAVGELERLLIREDHAWQRYFRVNGIRPLVVTYDELVRNLDAAVRRVFAFLQVPPPSTRFEEPPLERQADDLSERWLRLYRRSKLSISPDGGTSSMTAGERSVTP